VTEPLVHVPRPSPREPRTLEMKQQKEERRRSRLSRMNEARTGRSNHGLLDNLASHYRINIINLLSGSREGQRERGKEDAKKNDSTEGKRKRPLSPRRTYTSHNEIEYFIATKIRAEAPGATGKRKARRHRTKAIQTSEQQSRGHRALRSPNHQREFKLYLILSA